jgi:hypothetical protein
MLDQFQEQVHVSRVETDLTPTQTEMLVDNMMKEWRPRVGELLAEKVAVTVESRYLSLHGCG